MTERARETTAPPPPTCRHCGAPLRDVFVDLGHQPPSNAYLTAADLERPEITYPLKAYVCRECLLVQLPAHAGAEELFTPDYAYFSSVSRTWVEHARRYVAEVTERYRLGPDSFVVELASNDGYLLQFVKERGIPCLGIEPTHATAEAARSRGIETLEEFFGLTLGQRLAEERGQADLIVANNVLAHVPDLNDFVAGIASLLAPEGVATLEFPHLLRLILGRQFDTIYHEHYSYFSLHAARRVFRHAGLEIFDVEELPTHGGSLRIHAALAAAAEARMSERVAALLEEERRAGILEMDFYAGFQAQAEKIKNDLLTFLLEQKGKGATVAAYGAAAKGNTLLNFAGVKTDLLPFVCDAAPSKQGRFLPGSHIPILPPEELLERRPDHVLILPWNIRGEIMEAQAHVRDWGGRFVVAVPELKVFRT